MSDDSPWHAYIFWLKKTSKLDQPFANDTNNTTPYNFEVEQPLVLLNLEIIYTSGFATTHVVVSIRHPITY